VRLPARGGSGDGLTDATRTEASRLLRRLNRALR